MGVFWNSEAEIITDNNKNSQEILDYISKNGRDVSDNVPIDDINIKDSSIRLSSNGYGEYSGLFFNIFNNFGFPIFCHERVLPCQGQGYGFWRVCGKFKDESEFSHQENWYIDPDNKPDSEWVESVQILNIPKDWDERPELKKIIENAANNGTPIEHSYHDDLGDVYYLFDFLNNCIPEDEDIISSFFDKELENMCTWDLSIDIFDEYDEDVFNKYDEGDIYNNISNKRL